MKEFSTQYHFQYWKSAFYEFLWVFFILIYVFHWFLDINIISKIDFPHYLFGILDISIKKKLP